MKAPKNGQIARFTVDTTIVGHGGLQDLTISRGDLLMGLPNSCFLVFDKGWRGDTELPSYQVFDPGTLIPVVAQMWENVLMLPKDPCDGYGTGYDLKTGCLVFDFKAATRRPVFLESK